MELFIDFVTSMNSRYFRMAYSHDRNKFKFLMKEMNIKNIFYIKVDEFP